MNVYDINSTQGGSSWAKQSARGSSAFVKNEIDNRDFLDASTCFATDFTQRRVCKVFNHRDYHNYHDSDYKDVFWYKPELDEAHGELP